MNIQRRRFLKQLGASGLIVWGAEPLSLATNNASSQNLRSREQTADNRRFASQTIEADVLVAGGGLAGVCAALAAARHGVSVVLAQNRSRLGGNSSSEIRMHALGANSSKELRLWRETGLIEELKLTDAATNLQRSFEIWDLMLYDKVVSEPRIRLLLDTFVTNARLRQGLIISAEALCPTTETAYVIKAKFFLDCTGDSTLAAAAKAEMMRGREGRGTYGESLAPEKADLKTMGNSILFFARKHDRSMQYAAPAWARQFTDADFKHRPIKSWEYGYWWIEWGGDLDTIRDGQRIRHELLRNVLGIWDYIKNSGRHPASENWALEWVGMFPGKRESRRIKGDHVLTQHDLVETTMFEDRVAYGGWPIDDHPPGGIERTDIAPFTQIHFKQPYHVPLRCLYSVNRPNLLMAGRNISASHVAFASTRVMATCSTFGQAAGTTAAFCVIHDCLPRQIVRDPAKLNSLQQWLLKNDQAILQIRNEDPNDLARQAQVVASAETESGPATHVIDGWNRQRGDGLTHQWQAPMTAEGPWLELRWAQPQVLTCVQLSFDTGLDRRLYLSGQDNEYTSQIRGPQPETIADLTVLADSAQGWLPVASLKNNYLRLRRLTFPALTTSALRLHVTRNHGDKLARLFEVRCYR